MMQAGTMGETRHGPGSALALLLRLVAGVIGLFIVATVIVLTISFLLQFFAANPSTEFASWIFRHAKGPESPFAGSFPTYHLFGSSVLDASLLLAIVVWTLVGTALASLLAWFSSLMNS